MVATRRSNSPSLSEGSTVSVSASKRKVVFAPSVNEMEANKLSAKRRPRHNFPKPPKKFVKGTSHIHFHKKVASPKKGSDDDVTRVKMATGYLYIHKGGKAEFVRCK